MLTSDANQKVRCESIIDIHLSGRRTAQDTSVGSLSLWERTGVRAFEGYAGLKTEMTSD